MIPRPIRTATLAVALAFAAAAPAAAAPGEIGIEDSRILGVTGAPAPDAAAVVAQWRLLGIDSVRVTAFWDSIAPNGTAKQAPAGFTGKSHTDPRYKFASLDAAMKLVKDGGLQPMLTIHQTGPRWASREPNVSARSWKPDPKKYAAFAQAVATRYKAQVSRYLIGNEPNQRDFLSPQTICKKGKCDRTGPSMYRELARTGIAAIKQADRGSKVIIGELAPIGASVKNAKSMSPLQFIRGMACLDDTLKKVTTDSCKNYKKLKADGFGYHPYTIKTPPNKPNPDKNLAKIGDLKRLLGVIDATTKAKRLDAPGKDFQLFITEYGYETNPPDTRFGVSPAQQSIFNQQSAYIIFGLKNRIPLVTQYLWRDDVPPNPSLPYTGFQTGLLFANGTPKEGLATFPHPFWIDKANGRSKATVWGQVRPGKKSNVTVQESVGGGAFTTYATARSDAAGYFALKNRTVKAGAIYRFVYTNPLNGQPAVSGGQVG